MQVREAEKNSVELFITDRFKMFVLAITNPAFLI